MCRTLEKRKQVLEFFRKQFDMTGNIPFPEDAAEYLDISTAEVRSHIKEMIVSGDLIDIPGLGYWLLNHDGSVYRSNQSEFLKRSHLEICLEREVPYHFPDTAVVFFLLCDFRERFSLRHRDRVIVYPPDRRKLRAGDLIVVKYGEFFQLSVYMYSGYKKSLLAPEHIYDADSADGKIIGVVCGIYRNSFNCLTE